MELRDLRSFAAVARTGSFTAAAHELGYTQSAVSQHIAALEGELGRPLLQRRPVRLTAAGERLAEHVTHVLLRLDVAESELAALDDDTAQLRVAATPLARTDRIARALRAVRRTEPHRRLSLQTCAGLLAAAEVAAGRCDVAVVDGVVAPANPLAYTDTGLLMPFALDERPIGLAVPRGHPLAARSSVPLEAARDARWIDAPGLGLSPADLPGLALDAGTGFAYDGADVATLAALVATGHGLTVLPLDGPRHRGVSLVPVSAPRLVHRTELLVLRSAAERHQRLIELLQG